MSGLSDLIRGALGVEDRVPGIPPLDGALRQNDDLERCWPVIERLAELDDVAIAADGDIYLSAGRRILHYSEREGSHRIFAEVDADAGGLAVISQRRLAACISGRGVVIFDQGVPMLAIKDAGGTPIRCATAIATAPDGTLFIAEGSTRHAPAAWSRDLLELGASGRIIRADPASGKAEVVATGLRWPHGLAITPDGKSLLVAESWGHSLSLYSLAAKDLVERRELLTNLPGYPARITAAPGGGYWLAIFALRTQLGDFVLNEPEFRKAMLAEVDPDSWLAPAHISSAYDPYPWKSPYAATASPWTESVHAGRIRRDGAIKPWAPARSYGLVVKLDAEGQPTASLHAGANHVRHGITGAVEHAGGLYLACKGYGVLLKSSNLPGLERASETVQKRKTARERIRTFLAAQSAGGMEVAPKTFVHLENATKLYGGTAAIVEINFDLREGEVHALLGENGAGKSTLCKALAGAIPLTSGRILIDGQPRVFASAADALKAGVAMVYQETSLAPAMTVAQNIQLGQEALLKGTRRLNIEMQQFLASINFGAIDATSVVAGLGQGQKQMVEIARAIHFGARAIIFDEPTAALTPGETQRFFELIETLKARKLGIIFISHNLEEAMDMADRITIMRDGRHIVTDAAASFSRERIVRHMVGRDMGGTHYTQIGKRETRLTTRPRKVVTVENLRAAPLVKNASFSLYENEITGIAGLVGSGRSEMARVIAGALKRDIVRGGVITIDGKPARHTTPAAAIRDGIVYVTEDRKVDGFFETMGIDENIYLGALAGSGAKRIFVSKRERAALGKQWVERLGIRAIDLRLRVNRLSGGNQQKVVVAKSLTQNPRIVIIDEPTRGVDVGAIAEMHAYIRSLKGPGRVVVIISSYLPEILTLSDRVLVARQGRISAEFTGADASEHKIMMAAMG